MGMRRIKAAHRWVEFFVPFVHKSVLKSISFQLLQIKTSRLAAVYFFSLFKKVRDKQFVSQHLDGLFVTFPGTAKQNVRPVTGAACRIVEVLVVYGQALFSFFKPEFCKMIIWRDGQYRIQ